MDFFEKSPEEKLLEDIHRPGIEKLDLFVKMLRRNELFKMSIIIPPNQT